MSRITKDMTIDSIVAQLPVATEVFETVGIDYCCGGKSTLEMACKGRGISVAMVLERLGIQSDLEPTTADFDELENLSASELANHIERIHHQPLWADLERLDALSEKVARVHGHKEPRLMTMREVFLELVRDLSDHMTKEERILFPMIRSLETHGLYGASHCGTVANPIRQMESDHEQAEAAMLRIRELTDGFIPPDYACFSYRSLLSGLERMEADLRIHMRKESTLLFPKAVKLEQFHTEV